MPETFPDSGLSIKDAQLQREGDQKHWRSEGEHQIVLDSERREKKHWSEKRELSTSLCRQP